MRPWSILAAVVLAGCASKPAPEARADPPLAALVPADAVLLAGVRVEALEQTPIYRKYLAGAKFQPAEDFARQTGIDPRRDLRELLFFSNRARSSALLGRGRFTSVHAAEGVALIDPATIAVGEAGAISLLAGQRGKSHGPSAALTALMREVPPEAQVWAAYSGGAAGLPLSGNAARLFGSLESGTAYLDARQGLKGAASGLCTSEQAAEDVAGALKVMISLERLDQSIRVRRESRRVTVDVDAPSELVEKLISERYWRPPPR